MSSDDEDEMLNDHNEKSFQLDEEKIEIKLERNMFKTNQSLLIIDKG